jgi:hypothetical protein
MESLGELHPAPRRVAVVEHFTNCFLTQPEEQLGGVRETIGNYLQYFLTPEVAEIFCSRDSTFDVGDVDAGKIICVNMPQRFQTERRYVNTLLKLLFYNHALRRFDKVRSERAQDNLIILWADEAQRFMTASEDGTSDYNVVDVIREAGATIIATAQSTTSFVPPLGNERFVCVVKCHKRRLLGDPSDLRCRSPDKGWQTTSADETTFQRVAFRQLRMCLECALPISFHRSPTAR